MIPWQLGMQGNAAMYSNAHVWMQTFDSCCTAVTARSSWYKHGLQLLKTIAAKYVPGNAFLFLCQVVPLSYAMSVWC